MSAAKKMSDIKKHKDKVDEQWRESADWNSVAIRDEAKPAEILKLVLENGFMHVCQEKHPYFESDLNSSGLMLSNTDQFVNFPASSILAPKEVSPEKEQSLIKFEYNFSRASEKSEILKKMEEALVQTASSGTIRSDILLIADELSTNAIFNAPFVDLENTNSGASREDSSVHMSDGKSAKVFLAADESRLLIGCRDPYGTLNIDKLLTRVKSCYDNSVAANMNMTGSGGAGIGSFMVFNSAASYYVAVSEGKYTIVCCVLPMKMSNRARQELPKNLHFIKIK